MTSDDRFRALQEEAIDIAYRLADAEDQLQSWGAFAIELDALLDEYGIGRDGEPLIDSVRALVAKAKAESDWEME